MARRCKNKCGNELPTVKNCETIFQRRGYCDIDCLAEHTRKKNKEADRKKEVRATRKAKEKLKTLGDYAEEAQTAFNAWIRARDEGKVCISCQKPPKKKNAGHYRSVGAMAQLRYEPLNCHLQCEHCNTHLSSNAIEYRINLVKKIGVDKVDWLEGPHEPKRYRKEDYISIKQEYKNKLKELTT